MISPLRARVIAVLEKLATATARPACRCNPVGTFSALGGDSGVNVTWRCWDATEDELANLSRGIVVALRAGGLEVHELSTRICVLPPD